MINCVGELLTIRVFAESRPLCETSFVNKRGSDENALEYCIVLFWCVTFPTIFVSIFVPLLSRIPCCIDIQPIVSVP